MRECETIAAMQNLHNYFEHHALSQPMFLPEARAAKQVNTFLHRGQITPDEAAAVVAIMRSVEQSVYYDGSGWFDYKLRCSSLLRQLGYPTHAEQISI